jgi:acetyl-CoA C-acetyltransferase
MRIERTLICSPKRSAVGSFLGGLSSLTASELGAKAIRASVVASGLNPEKIQEVYMGCVLTAGLGQAPARQAALWGGLSKNVACTTVGKVCGSGLKTVMLADSAIRAGDIECAIAGGMESMSNSPYLLPKIRSGLRMGPGELTDSMIKDGLWDVYNNFHMGSATEILNREFKITREAQDEFAISSYQRALISIEKGLFKDEIFNIEIPSKKGPILFDKDEEPYKSDLTKIPTLKPVFQKDGSITAANASTLNDGSAAMIVCSESFAVKNSLKPLAQIVAHNQAAQEPEWFTTAPAASMTALLHKAGLKVSEIDVWEINEAFASVALANLQILKLDRNLVNPRGGAIALGHPIGASGARILTTLVHTLAQEKKRYGCASLCIGGGEAVSMIVESLHE